VNPREVKRFINTYSLQTLIRPDLVPEAILALQTIAFRPDWRPWYEAVIARPNEFREAIETYITSAAGVYDIEMSLSEDKNLLLPGKERERDNVEGTFLRISGTQLELSDEIRAFLSSGLMEALAEEPDLDPYVSSLQSTRTPELPGVVAVPSITRSCGFTEGAVACATIMAFHVRPYPMPYCPNPRGLTAHLFVW
jgi:hypothetical protein